VGSCRGSLGRFRQAPDERIRRTAFDDRIDHRDLAESNVPIDATEPTDNTDSADPIDATERTDPTDPIESTDPFEAMLRKEP
jgi:hypothetical protein